MTRETSRKAYLELVSNGRLGTMQYQVYTALERLGPATAQELVSAGTTGAWKRLPELRDLGIVFEVGKRRCRVTGRTAIVWDVEQSEPLLF